MVGHLPSGHSNPYTGQGGDNQNGTSALYAWQRWKRTL